MYWLCPDEDFGISYELLHPKTLYCSSNSSAIEIEEAWYIVQSMAWKESTRRHGNGFWGNPVPKYPAFCLARMQLCGLVTTLQVLSAPLLRSTCPLAALHIATQASGVSVPHRLHVGEKERLSKLSHCIASYMNAHALGQLSEEEHAQAVWCPRSQAQVFVI